MFILDTNVVSELRRRDRANPQVLAWADSVSQPDLFISVITVLEIETGILALKRRDARQGEVLRDWLEGYILPSFANRILPVDLPVARRCAALHVPDRKSERDAYIAATAMVHGLAVVTRNMCDFQSMGVGLINPWEANNK